MKLKKLKSETYHHIKATNSKALSTLKGIVEGVGCDNQLNELEIKKVLDWIDSYSFLKNQPGMSSVFDYLSTALSDGILTLDESKDIINMIDVNLLSYYGDATQKMQQLHGLLEGIAADQDINGFEYAYLWEWLNKNENLKGVFPYDEIYSLICQIGTNRLITPEQKKYLLNVFGWANTETVKFDNPFVPWAIDPIILFPNKVFCITGISSKMNRNQIAEIIQEKGGSVVRDVSKKLDYLLVCAEANIAWAHACYGRKIESAIKNRRAEKSKLLIVAEKDFWDTLVS